MNQIDLKDVHNNPGDLRIGDTVEVFAKDEDYPVIGWSDSVLPPRYKATVQNINEDVLLVTREHDEVYPIVNEAAIRVIEEIYKKEVEIAAKRLSDWIDEQVLSKILREG